MVLNRKKKNINKINILKLTSDINNYHNYKRREGNNSESKSLLKTKHCT